MSDPTSRQDQAALTLAFIAASTRTLPPLLPDGWQGQHEPQHRHTRLERADGCSLTVSVDGADPSRVRVTASLPSLETMPYHSRYDFKALSASVGRALGVDRVATAITRRLLPQLDADMEQAVARSNVHVQQVAWAHQVAEDLVEAHPGARRYGHPQRLHDEDAAVITVQLPGQRLRFAVVDGRIENVHLDVPGLSDAQAVAMVLALVKVPE